MWKNLLLAIMLTGCYPVINVNDAEVVVNADGDADTDADTDADSDTDTDTATPTVPSEWADSGGDTETYLDTGSWTWTLDSGTTISTTPYTDSGVDTGYN